jgi:hypothetical protein
MPRPRVYAAPFLAVLLICLQVGPVRPAILEKASQLLCLVNTAANPIPLSAFIRRMPDESGVTYSLPANTAFVLTKLSWKFTATNTALNGDALLTIGNYYRIRITLVNGVCGANDGLTMGVPITDMNQPVKVSLFGDETGTPIQGMLAIRLWGYTAPDK